MTQKKLTALKVASLKYSPLQSKGTTNPGALLPNRIPDADGLYLAILPSGVKSWRYDYRLSGSRRVIVYGTYPDVTLERARELHIDARRAISRGEAPVIVNGKIGTRAERIKARSTGDSRFKSVGEEWYAAELAAKQKSQSWKENYRRWLDWAYEDLASLKLEQIEAADVLASVKKVQARGHAVSAEHLRQTIARVFDYGILNLRAPRGFNPALAIKGAVIVPPAKHRPKLDAKDIPAFLKAIDTHPREDLRLALKILINCFTRKEELTEAPWKEIDLGAGIWLIDASRMKKGRDHEIPLSSQVLTMFTRLRQLAGDSPFVFPGTSGKPIHRNALNDAIKQIGYTGEQIVPHGMRGTAASILSDAGWDKEVLKAQLAHGKESATDAAYFRNTFLEQRKLLLQTWSNTLDALAAGVQIVPIRAGKAA